MVHPRKDWTWDLKTEPRRISSTRQVMLLYPDGIVKATVPFVGRQDDRKLLQCCSRRHRCLCPVFLPSFSYLATLMDYLRSSQKLERIKAKKATFAEPRGAAEAEEIFKQYKAACKANVRSCPLIPIIDCRFLFRTHIWLERFCFVLWVGRCQKALTSAMDSDGNQQPPCILNGSVPSSSVLMLGLPCQTAMIQSFKKECGTWTQPRIVHST